MEKGREEGAEGRGQRREEERGWGDRKGVLRTEKGEGFRGLRGARK
jgi:hypothetical protein